MVRASSRKQCKAHSFTKSYYELSHSKGQTVINVLINTYPKYDSYLHIRPRQYQLFPFFKLIIFNSIILFVVFANLKICCFWFFFYVLLLIFYILQYLVNKNTFSANFLSCKKLYILNDYHLKSHQPPDHASGR